VDPRIVRRLTVTYLDGATGHPASRTTERKLTPMPSVVIRQKVADYATWKPIFDGHTSTRRANGSQGGRLFRNAADPNEILVLFEWDDLDRARLFTQSDDLHEGMAHAGVVDRPDLWFLEEIDQPPA
jgi:hypothetical protein